MILKPKEIQALKCLGKYKFLTYDQMIKLGVSKDKGNLSRYLKGLSKRKNPLVRSIPASFGTSTKHYLTSEGSRQLKICLEDQDSIHFVEKPIVKDTQDQKHRMSIIDIQIAIDLHNQDQDVKTILSERYFDTVGNNRISRNLKCKTAFKFNDKESVKADLITILDLSDTQSELYIVELENGKDTKKALEKIENHKSAILNKSANKKYDFDKGYRTLWIFEHSSTMNATLERIEQNPINTRLEEFFLFKSLEEVLENPYDGWLNLAKKERKLYYRYS